MSKIFDGVFGFVIGDAMGVPTEFCIRENLMQNPIKDMIGYGSHNVAAGTWSDDSSMTFALIDSINRKKCIDYNDIMDNFYLWLNDAKFTATNKVFDIGRTCLNSILNYSKHKLPVLNCGENSLFSNGNGSLMRILPLAYYIYYNNINDEKTIITLVNNISSLTHAHEISKMACYLYVKYVLFLLEGYDKFESYTLIKELNYDMYSFETIDTFSRILKDNIFCYSLNDISSSGYVVSTLEASLWVLMNTDSFEDSIIKAINLGNDTDTIAAICGSMSGIIYGFNSIPKKWYNALLKKDYIIDLLNTFESTICKSIYNPVLGAIVGDIVGSKYEAYNHKSKDFNFFDKNYCKATDDSIMTLAVANSLLECNYDFENLDKIAIKNMCNIGRKYIDCGFGRNFYDWILSDNPIPYNSYGNGSAMRISACGIIGRTKIEVKHISNKLTYISHNHPDGLKGAEATAMTIYLIKSGMKKDELKKYFTKNYYPIKFSLEHLQKNYTFEISCKNTVPQAFLAFYESVNFEDAIRNAISIGGDSDTIAAICGSFAAIYYGVPKYIYDEALSFLDNYQLDLYNKFSTYLDKI